MIGHYIPNEWPLIRPDKKYLNIEFFSRDLSANLDTRSKSDTRFILYRNILF